MTISQFESRRLHRSISYGYYSTTDCVRGPRVASRGAFSYVLSAAALGMYLAPMLRLDDRDDRACGIAPDRVRPRGTTNFAPVTRESR